MRVGYNLFLEFITIKLGVKRLLSVSIYQLCIHNRTHTRIYI